MSNIKKDEEFLEWTKQLDKRFLQWSWQSLKSFDEHVVRNNVKGYDRVFKGSSDICHAPGCRYPVRGQERLPVIGDVCNLCYFMFHLVNARAYWIAVQQQDDFRDKKRG